MKAEIKIPSVPNFYIDVEGTVEEILAILIMINEGRLLVEAPPVEDAESCGSRTFRGLGDPLVRPGKATSSPT